MSEKDKQKLKPCPWCNNIPHLMKTNYGSYMIQCFKATECEMIPSVVRPTEEEAINAWNTRSPQGLDCPSCGLSNGFHRYDCHFVVDTPSPPTCDG